MLNIRKYISQLSHYFSASLIPMLLSLLINPLVSLNMNPEDFAITGYFTSFSTLITPIITFYMVHYYNKRYFELDDLGREYLRALLYKSLIFITFTLSLACFIVLKVYIEYVSETSFKTFPYLLMTVMSIPFIGIYNLELADYKMNRDSKKYLRLSLVKGVGTSLMILLFVVLFKWGAFGKLLAPLLINVVVFIYLFVKHIDVWKIKTDYKGVFETLKFCWPLALGASLGYFSNGYDKAILEPLGDIKEFGYYCVGLSLANYISVFTTSISSTFQPDTYEAIVKDNRRQLSKVVAVRFGLTLGVVIIFVLLCPFIVRVLTAGRYMESVPYARISALVALTSTLYYVINDYSIARGKPHLYLITTILGSVAIMFLMPYFVARFSFNGAAIMNVLSFVILFIINWFLLIFTNGKIKSSVDN